MSGFTTVNVVHGGVRVQTQPGGPAEGDLTGSYEVGPIVDAIQTYPVDPRSPNNGDSLIFNGGEWIPTPSPSSVTYFQGSWDASVLPKGDPDITMHVGLKDGDLWIVSVAGNATVGGITGWLVGDYALYSDGDWYKLSNGSFGWLLTGNNGTNPTINFIGTADPHDLSIRANAIEGLSIKTTGNVTAAKDLTVTGNITGSNAKFTGDLAVCGGDITTNASTFNLLTGVSAVLNIGNVSAINSISGTTKFPQGISGSLTRLTDGTSAFIADNGIIITSASNGAVTFKVDETKFAALTGSTFTGPVSFDAGLSGSLTKLADGSSYLIAGTNMTVITNSNGSVTLTAIPSGSNTQVQFNDGGSVFGGSAGLTFNKTTNSITVTGDITGSNERLSGNLAVNGGSLTTTATTFNLTNTTATTVNIGGGATSAVNIGNSSGTNIVSGTTKFPQALSGSLTKLVDGTDYLKAGGNISTTTGSGGAVTVSFSAGTPGSGDVLSFNGTAWAPSSIVSTLQTSYQTVSASEAIAAGDVCYVVNSGGSSNIPTIARAQANNIQTIRGVLGLASGSIAKNTTGSLQTYGQLAGPVNTQGFAQGAPLFVSPTTPGGVTDVKPSYPNYAFQVGIVTRQGQPNNVTSGIVFVSPIMQSDTYNLGNVDHANAAIDDLLVCVSGAQAAGGGNPALPPVYASKRKVKEYATMNAYSVNAGFTIPTSAFDAAGAQVVYLPLTSGNTTVASSNTPIALLTANDYGRELWLHNIGNANITITRAASQGQRTVALEGSVSLVLAPGTIAKFMWLNPGSARELWYQTEKAVTVG